MSITCIYGNTWLFTKWHILLVYIYFLRENRKGVDFVASYMCLIRCIEIFTPWRKEKKDSQVNCFVGHDSNWCNIRQWCYIYMQMKCKVLKLSKNWRKVLIFIQTNICEDDMETNMYSVLLAYAYNLICHENSQKNHKMD